MLNIPQALTFMNAQQLMAAIENFITTKDKFVTVCSARQSFYDTLRVQYDSCTDVSYLVSRGSSVRNAVLYAHLVRHLEFMCGGGFTKYVNDFDCFMANNNAPSVNPCYTNFNNSVYHDYSQLCPAVAVFISCVNDGYGALCGNRAGWTMCEYERVGYSYGCSGLRCVLGN